MEGRDIPKGTVDVVVCDGFVGNVVLKFAEGLVSVVQDILKEGIKQSSIISKLGALLIVPVFKKIKKTTRSHRKWRSTSIRGKWCIYYLPW